MRRGYRPYGYHKCYHPHATDGLIALLLIFALYILAMPFYGGYVLAHATTEGEKAKGTVLLVIGCFIYIAGIISSIAGS